MKNDKKSLISSLTLQGFAGNIAEAFQSVPREDFIPADYRPFAYCDEALPLEQGSTISQPSTIAFMLKLLELNPLANTVLEIGSGCGYVLALINKITPKSIIHGIEINNNIYAKSLTLLKGYSNIKVYCKDGKNGLPDFAPFDRILISAACEKPPYHLLGQLNSNGIIVSSVQNSILKIIKKKNSFSEEEFPGFRFVPLI